MRKTWANVHRRNKDCLWELMEVYRYSKDIFEGRVQGIKKMRCEDYLIDNLKETKKMIEWLLQTAEELRGNEITEWAYDKIGKLDKDELYNG